MSTLPEVLARHVGEPIALNPFDPLTTLVMPLVEVGSDHFAVDSGSGVLLRFPFAGVMKVTEAVAGQRLQPPKDYDKKLVYFVHVVVYQQVVYTGGWTVGVAFSG